MNLTYFVGKACSVFTHPVNRNFNEKQLQDYFVGLVESVDARGVWTTHPITGCKNYYPMENIIAICEEQVVHDQKILEKYKEAKKEVEAPIATPGDTTFIDHEMMVRLSQQDKQLS